MNAQIKALIDTVIAEKNPSGNTKERIGDLFNQLNIHKADIETTFSKSETLDLINEVKILATSGSIFYGSITPTSVIPGDGNIWGFAEAGTYPNAGGIVVPANTFAVLSRSGTVWSSVKVSMPQASNNIKKLADISFPAPADTQTMYDDGNGLYMWQVKPGQTATVTDIPSDAEDSKWIRVSNSVLNKNTITGIIKNDIFTTSQYLNNANVFSGFGFNHGIFNNFNQAIIRIGQISGTSNTVTEVNIRICEGSYTGTELARATKSVVIPEGTEQEITFDFPRVANASNANLWVEYWCNGKTGLCKGSTGTVTAYRYKTTSHTYGDFSVQSTASSPGADNTRFYLKLNNLTSEFVIKPELTSDTVLLGEDKPVTSNAVALEFKEYDNAITDGFNADTTIVKGNTNVNVQTSTFVGWGQLWGVLNNFNRVGYLYSAFDAALLPTTATCRIRIGSSTGAIIFEQEKPVTFALNVAKMVYFDLPAIYPNTDNDEIFISFTANGRIRLIGGLSTVAFDAAHQVKYSTVVGQTTTPGTVSTPTYQMYCQILKGTVVKQISDNEIQRIGEKLGGYPVPDLNLPRIIRVGAGLQLNIFNENVCIPKYGDNLSNYRLNFDGTSGQQFRRGFQLSNTPASLNTNVTLTLTKGRDTITAKSVNIVSPAANAGTGVNRKVLIIGDSTVNGSNISTPLKALFDADPMDITLIGTLGAAGVKHEGRGGWTINDYYGQGRALYRINYTSITTFPSNGARYSQGANTYNVEEVNPTEGYFSVSIVTGSAPTASGTLTKVSGSGDTSIAYGSSSQTPGNPFYFATTGKFDIGYYLTNTSQSLTDNDWIFFQLGINDVFSISDLTAADAKVATMATQMNDIIANIKAYNANIRVGIVVTFPPANQDAFGYTYSLGQLSEMYIRTGLVTWQKKVLEIYDTAASEANKVYAVPAHTNLDSPNNFPVITRPVNSRNTTTEVIQSNGVHPFTTGYAQIADTYFGIIKFFA